MNHQPFRRVCLVLTVTAVVWSRPAAAGGQQASQPSSLSSGQPARSAPLAVPPGSFLGGVPSGPATDEVLRLTIVNAIARSLEHNLGVLMAEETLGKAQGARWRALSGLLPQVNGRVADTRQTINLAAFGFGGASDSPFGDLPTIVGPFNVFDARMFLSQPVIDFGALHGARAEEHNVEAARLTFKSARDYVINVAGTLYVQALAASARADAARVQLQTAQTLLTQAVDLKQNGLIAGIDVLRADVQASVQTQRVTVAVNEFEKAKLQLARAIGLPLGQRFDLDPALPDLPAADLSLDAAVALANGARPDYKAALERVSAAEAARRSISGEALPSVRVHADYGAIGLSPSDARATFAVTGAVNVPIFQGGRTRGRLLEADADIRTRRAEAEDLKAAIYYEVRTAFLDLDATSKQLALAGQTRDLAAQQLVQARDRFAAGVTNNVEVVQAQDAVATATEQFIAAKYGYDLAKGALQRGVGGSDDLLRRLLGGSR